MLHLPSSRYERLRIAAMHHWGVIKFLNWFDLKKNESQLPFVCLLPFVLPLCPSSSDLTTLLAFQQRNTRTLFADFSEFFLRILLVGPTNRNTMN